MDPTPAMFEYFGPDDTVDISTRLRWWNCYFEDCTIEGESRPEQDFWRCHFHGRAAEWLQRQMSATKATQ
jgi:hypothetical protein